MEEAKGLDERQKKELRRCLLEGLPRADYLMKREELRKKTGGSVHEKNYWTAMRKIGKLFRD